jgi:hypothetical protein
MARSLLEDRVCDSLNVKRIVFFSVSCGFIFFCLFVELLKQVTCALENIGVMEEVHVLFIILKVVEQAGHRCACNDILKHLVIFMQTSCYLNGSVFFWCHHLSCE